MKKILILALMLCLAFAGCEKTVTPNAGEAETEFTECVTEAVSPTEKVKFEVTEKEIEKANALFAVAYFGACDGDYAQVSDYIEERGFENIFTSLDELEKERFVFNEGSELYYIIPANENVKLTVNEYYFDVENDYQAVSGEELVSTVGLSVLVRGNISDIFPNLIVTAEYGERQVTYSPHLNMKDGRLNVPYEGVCDFTPYNSMSEYYDSDVQWETEFCGKWVCDTETSDGQKRTLFLNLQPNGEVDYRYGETENDTLEIYEGTWNHQGDVLVMTLIGGSVDSLGELNEDVFVYYWYVSSDGLRLEHADGGKLLNNANNTFLFEAIEE